jgi:hypothetical protein
MNVPTIVTMVLVGVVGLLGLFAAAHAVDLGMYVFGLVLTAFAVIVDFWLLKHHFDSEAAPGA